MVRDNLDSNTAPWDPIWSFLVGDHDKLLKKTIENPEETQTQQLPPKTQTPTNLFPVLLNSGVDHRDDHQSHHSYESSVDSLNRTITLSESTDTEDYTANSPWHWELDDTYFTGIDDDTPDPEDMNKRKVRFSPFKQVSLLEYTLTSVVDDKFRQSFDKNDFANAHDLQEPDGVFSLSEFLENWREFSTSDESVCQDSTYTETNDFKTPQDDSKRSMNGYSMLSNSLNNETHINDNKLQHSLETKSISKKQNIPKPDFDDDMESSPDIPLAYGVRIDQDHYNSIPSGMDDVCSPDVVIAKPLTSSRFSRFSGRGFGMTKWSRTKSQSRSQSQSQVQIKLGGGAKIHEMNSNGFSQIASTSSFNNRGDETLTGAATIPITSSHIGHSSLQVESENLGQYNQNALFEYDYESGNQISLSYSEFGLEPKFLAMVEKSNKQSFLASRQEAIVQIEVRLIL